MEIIIIGGIPASGKTTKGKDLGKEYNCLSIELEALRWDFFQDDLENNVYRYTNNEIKENESLREYYLRNSIYESTMNLNTFKEWNLDTLKYVNDKANNIIKELKEIYDKKSIYKLKTFIKNNQTIINYVPNQINIKILDKIVVSHALISRMDIANIATKSIILDTDLNTCKERFRARENLEKNTFDKEITDYLNTYKKCIEKNEMPDVRIKTDDFSFHLRVGAIITKNNKYLIQNIEGYNYYIIPGGHNHLGESSNKALIREVKEEIGCTVLNSNIFSLHENIYSKNDIKEHWVETYFAVETKEELSDDDFTVTENDNGKIRILNYKWVTKEELKEIDLRPISIKELLVEKEIDSFNYLVDEV